MKDVWHFIHHKRTLSVDENVNQYPTEKRETDAEVWFSRGIPFPGKESAPQCRWCSTGQHWTNLIPVAQVSKISRWRNGCLTESSCSKSLPFLLERANDRAKPQLSTCLTLSCSLHNLAFVQNKAEAEPSYTLPGLDTLYCETSYVAREELYPPSSISVLVRARVTLPKGHFSGFLLSFGNWTNWGKTKREGGREDKGAPWIAADKRGLWRKRKEGVCQGCDGT